MSRRYAFLITIIAGQRFTRAVLFMLGIINFTRLLATRYTPGSEPGRFERTNTAGFYITRQDHVPINLPYHLQNNGLPNSNILHISH